jgi:hypothetical protein
VRQSCLTNSQEEVAKSHPLASLSFSSISLAPRPSLSDPLSPQAPSQIYYDGDPKYETA